jgi:hypothetical protein
LGIAASSSANTLEPIILLRKVERAGHDGDQLLGIAAQQQEQRRQQGNRSNQMKAA